MVVILMIVILSVILLVLFSLLNVTVGVSAGFFFISMLLHFSKLPLVSVHSSLKIKLWRNLKVVFTDVPQSSFRTMVRRQVMTIYYDSLAFKMKYLGQ